MRPQKFDIDLADKDADGLADNNDSSGTSLTLDGALTSGGTFTSADGLGRRISITDTATTDQSGATFTITGTNANGQAISEDVTGPGSGATVVSTKYFYTVTSISIASGAGTGTVDVGTNGEAAGKIYPLNWRNDDRATVAIAGSTGTFQADIEETFDDVISAEVDNANLIEAYADKTGDGSFLLTRFARGVRVHTDSYTNGAEFQFHVLQSR